MPRPGVDGKTIFDQDAGLYDRARPGYPDQLIEDIIACSEIPDGGRILEIGCGPGKATCPFAEHGYSILCIEPGPNMAAVTMEKCRDYLVQVDISSFEDWPIQENAFDLAISASAFHWLDEKIRVPKVAQALKPGGTIALFWNKRPGPVSDIFIEANRIYAKHAPELAQDESEMRERRGLTGEQIRGMADEIDATGLFGPVTIKTYPWSKTYTSREYVDLLNTYSGHRILPEEQKRPLFEAIAKVIDEHGGIITRECTSLLYLARKK